jgi:hypothetical protein
MLSLRLESGGKGGGGVDKILLSCESRASADCAEGGGGGGAAECILDITPVALTTFWNKLPNLTAAAVGGGGGGALSSPLLLSPLFGS